MSLKYAVNVVAALGAGLLVVSSLVFSPTTAGWLGFGVSTGVLALVLAGVAVSRLSARSIGYGVTAVVATWGLIASLVFSGPALGWLVFADALGLLVAALADLTVHEVTTERVVHTLEISEHRTPASV